MTHPLSEAGTSVGFNMSKEQTDILPCPFCLGEAELVHAAHGYFVRCMSCNEQFSHGSAASAVSAWNRRASPSPAGGVQAVKVQSLEWIDNEAVTPFGRYKVIRTPDGYAAAFELEEIAHVGFRAVDPMHGARRAAQDHAQSDFEYRILSALSSQAQTTGGV